MVGNPAGVHLEDIDPDDERLLADVLPVLRELRTQLTAAQLSDIYRHGHPQGLRFLAAYDDGRCVGVAGWRILHTTSSFRKLYVDDLVTTETQRSTGVGRTLLEELTLRGVEAGCTCLDLDSGVQRREAHRFYFREGLTITSFHFRRPLGTSDSY